MAADCASTPLLRVLTGLVAAMALAVSLAGCFAGEDPLPPEKALAQAAQRIDAILVEDRALQASPPAPVLPKEPDNAQEVDFWYCTHPLIARVAMEPRHLMTFSEQYPDISLKRQFIGDWHVAIQKLTVNLAVGDVPDIALVKRDWLARLAASGRLAPLDELLPAALLDDLREPARRSLTVNGHLYALPADGFCSVLLVNQDKAPGPPPATWEDLRHAAQALPKPAPGGPSWPIGYLPFIETLWSTGGRVCDPYGSGLDTVPAKEALAFLIALRDEGLAHRRMLADATGALEAFLGGNVAMTCASSECLPRALRAPFKLAVAPLPGKNGPVSMMSENALVVFADRAAARCEAIASVLGYLTGPDVQGEEAAQAGSVPVRKSVAQEVSTMTGLESAFGVAKAPPLIPSWGAVAFELARCLDLAYRWEPPAEP